ncbi:XRE family transcriptional regulator [Candidatus Gastranaerophilales bacterium]|nr:MAG: XRE family transcriptional regulator [Candidatus Gastranaerophilales bacterium]
MCNYECVLKKIGINFKIERIKKKLSQERFAELANVHTNYIGKVERGEQNLTVKSIVSLAESLNVPLENILKLD